MGMMGKVHNSISCVNLRFPDVSCSHPSPLFLGAIWQLRPEEEATFDRVKDLTVGQAHDEHGQTPGDDHQHDDVAAMKPRRIESVERATHQIGLK